jgi:uncharacterized protein (DUF1800 family)
MMHKLTLRGALRGAATALLTLVLTACGGGGGSGGAAPVAPPANDVGGSGGGVEDPGTGDAAPLRDIEIASRLASRTTFGSDLATIEQITAAGGSAWLNEQFALPASSHDAVVQMLLEREAAGDFDALREGNDGVAIAALFGRAAWWHTTITAPDQLRQRVAYALSQIFVISDEVNLLLVHPFGTSNYYDMLLDNAFGNFRDLLLDVALHPAMGVYLSHLNNAKSDPEAGTFPDENFAREVMQLFSIGLFELNADGTEITDGDGRPVPTYSNAEIGEFARVFTGLSWGGENPRFGSNRYVFRQPMRMFEAFHDTGSKTLLRGEVIPAGLPGMADVERAIDNLFNHPNVGPFFGRQLIQRLVSSNPSPDYVARVTAAFNDNGAGVRGDMQAVLRAVLLDPEALAEPDPDATRGKLREPLLRFTAMLRQLGVVMPDGFYANIGYGLQQQIQQHPLAAPSVFNFYLPTHQPIGRFAERGLVAPELQITNSNTIVELSNLLQFAVVGGYVNDLQAPPFSAASLSFRDFEPLVDDTDALLDRLDTVFTYGTLSRATREAIAGQIAFIDDADLRLRVAAWLLLISPDYAVEL